MKKSRKILTIALSILLVVVLAACQAAPTTTAGTTAAGTTAAGTTAITTKATTAAPTTTKPKEPLKMRYVGWGSLFEPFNEGVAAVNEKLKKDGLGLVLSVTFIPGEQYIQKVSLMISTGEEFDLFQIMEEIGAIKSGLTKLDDYINQYGPVLKTAFPEKTWEYLKVDGGIYGIPCYWRDTTNSGGSIGDLHVRTDKMAKAGLTKYPTTAEEYLVFVEQLQKNWGGSEKVYVWDHTMNRWPIWLHRTYDTWPFYVDYGVGFFYVDQKGNVKSWLEAEEFKKDCTFFRTLYTKGLIHPDILSLPADTRSKLAQKGDILASPTMGLEAIPNLKKNVDPNADIDLFFLAPEKKVLVSELLWNKNGVPITTKHPEAAIQFLNWLHSSAENHDLLIYGIKGKHYNDAANGRIDRVFGSDGQPVYNHQLGWQLAYAKFVKYGPVNPVKEIELYQIPNKNAEMSITVGFVFNTAPVKTEYANCLAEMQSVIYPLRWGVVDFDKNYPEAVKRMKAAGIDKVVAEYEKQFKAWLAKK